MTGRLNIIGRLLKYARTFWRLGSIAKRRYDVSRWSMLREHMALRRATRLRLQEYFTYGLCDPLMSRERKMEYVGQALMRPLWSALNPIEYRYLFKNKLIFKHLCRAKDLPAPSLLGTFDPDYGVDANGSPLCTPQDLSRWAEENEGTDFVVKPAEGAEGQMVLSLRAQADEDCVFRSVNGEGWKARELYDYLTDQDKIEAACSGVPEIRPVFLFEERLRSHPALAELSPETLCTFRIVTLRERGLDTQIIAASFKLQPSSSGADNIARGAMAISIDAENGRLGTGWIKPHDGEMPSVKRYKAPPGTDIHFTGKEIPFWKEVCDLSRTAADAFPYVRAVGWDIAVTGEGPYLLEGNWAWGETLAQGGSGRGIYRGHFKEVCERLRAEGRADKALV